MIPWCSGYSFDLGLMFFSAIFLSEFSDFEFAFLFFLILFNLFTAFTETSFSNGFLDSFILLFFICENLFSSFLFSFDSLLLTLLVFFPKKSLSLYSLLFSIFDSDKLIILLTLGLFSLFLKYINL